MKIRGVRVEPEEVEAVLRRLGHQGYSQRGLPMGFLLKHIEPVENLAFSEDVNNSDSTRAKAFLACLTLLQRFCVFVSRFKTYTSDEDYRFLVFIFFSIHFQLRQDNHLELESGNGPRPALKEVGICSKSKRSWMNVSTLYLVISRCQVAVVASREPAELVAFVNLRDGRAKTVLRASHSPASWLD